MKRDKTRELLQDAVVALKQAESALIKRRVNYSAHAEPIAVVGYSCRLPGGATSPTRYWELLCEGFDGTSPHPKSRWQWNEYFNEDPFHSEAIYTQRGGYLLDDVAAFDAHFFGISPREAERIDPQQRLLLEVVWEALENAGLPAHLLRASKTGVFVGQSTEDYADVLLHGSNVVDTLDLHASLGLSRSVTAGRIASLLGLQGPTLQLDTACSSSLMAVHLACQSLRTGECEVALAGGVNLILSPISLLSRCRMQAVSPDGRCKTFSEEADGYGQGEGAGIIVLKLLSRAEADGDDIRAVIRGSAANHNGPSSGLTVPNREAQRRVIEEALAQAELEPEAIDYVEAHGTGTVLGDPLEIAALGDVFATKCQRQRPLFIGSAKTNIGHLEAAAGVACLLKTCLMVENGQIPPHLHAERRNSRIPWEALPFAVPTTKVSWPHEEKLRRAGVSSFGISGTNVHVVVESYYDSHKFKASSPTRSIIVPLSAHSDAARMRQAELLSSIVRESSFVEVGAALARGRASLSSRAACVATSQEELLSRLSALVNGENSEGLFTSKPGVKNHNPLPVAFLFTGQGSQYGGMGERLFSTSHQFRSAIIRFGKILADTLPVPLSDLLIHQSHTQTLVDTRFTQPVLCAFEMALSDMWKAYGIRPDYVIGHSLGEFAAAYCAGVLTAEETLQLVSARGRLMSELPQDGSMIAVISSAERVRELLAEFPLLSLAAVNSPSRVTVSGPASEMSTLGGVLKRNGVRFLELSVSHAFHSVCMEPMLGEFEDLCSTIVFKTPQIPLVSNVSGKLASDEITNARYWREHVRGTVEFRRGLETLKESGVGTLLEIGPKPVLLAFAREMFESETLFLESLAEGKAADTTTSTSLGKLFCRGYDICWDEVFSSDSKRMVRELPLYPWERKRYWLEKTPQRSIVKDESWRTSFNQQEQETIERFLTSMSSRCELSESQDQRRSEFFEICWREVNDLRSFTAGPPAFPKAVLMVDCVSARSPMLREVQRTWNDLGVTAYLVTHAQESEYERHEGRIISANLTKPQQVQRLVRDVISQLGVSPHVIFFSGEETLDKHVASLSALRETLQAFLRLTRSTDNFFTLAICTPEGPSQSSLWSLGRSIALENPKILTSSIIVSAQDDGLLPDLCGLLTHPAVSTTGENWRLENGKSSVARIAALQAPLSSRARETIAAHGRSYLVTGGAGATGNVLVERLVREGASTVVVVGRRPISELPQGLLRFTERGSVAYEQGDCSDEAFMGSVFAKFGESLPRLAGVFHLAGSAVQRPFATTSDEALEELFSAKVKGAIVLDRLSRNHELDYFVLFSSLSAAIGAKGYSGYGAANGFLNGLARERRARGLPATSLCFGPFSEGRLADETLRASLSEQGVHALSADEVLRFVEDGLHTESAELIAAPITWATFSEVYSSRQRQYLLDEVTTKKQVSSDPGGIRFPTTQNRRDDLYTNIVSSLATILKLESVDEVDPDCGFFDMGMDSLLVIELKEEIERLIGTEIDRTAVFNYPTVNSLLDYLTSEVLKWERAKNRSHEDHASRESVVRPASNTEPQGADSTLDELESLIDSEMDLLSKD